MISRSDWKKVENNDDVHVAFVVFFCQRSGRSNRKSARKDNKNQENSALNLKIKQIFQGL